MASESLLSKLSSSAPVLTMVGENEITSIVPASRSNASSLASSAIKLVPCQPESTCSIETSTPHTSQSAPSKSSTAELAKPLLRASTLTDPTSTDEEDDVVDIRSGSCAPLSHPPVYSNVFSSSVFSNLITIIRTARYRRFETRSRMTNLNNADKNVSLVIHRKMSEDEVCRKKSEVDSDNGNSDYLHP